MSTIPMNLSRWTTRRLRGLGIALSLLVLAGLIGLGRWVQDEWAVRDAARSARRALATGRLAAAEAPLGRWLAARPGAADAHFLKARVAFGRERLQEAIEELARARFLGYPAPPLDRLDAILRARAGRYHEAESVLRRILEQSPEPDPEVAQALAKVYLETYRFQAAADVLARWMRDAPNDPKPYLWRTEVDARLDPPPAQKIADYREALRRDSHLDQARLGLADELRSRHELSEAAAESAAYLAHRPDDPAGLIAAGLTALESGDEDAAVRHLDQALKFAPDDPVALAGRARLALRRGELAAALAWLDRAIRLQPHDMANHYHRGLCLARLGRRAEANTEQEAAERLRQDDVELVKIQRALLHDPENIELQARVANWLIEHGHEQEGLRWARKILSERPEHAAANRMLADQYERRGQSGLANYHRLQAARAR
jgi:tetratricopeptide (TPR) repeat protein